MITIKLGIIKDGKYLSIIGEIKEESLETCIHFEGKTMKEVIKTIILPDLFDELYKKLECDKDEN